METSIIRLAKLGGVHETLWKVSEKSSDNLHYNFTEVKVKC